MDHGDRKAALPLPFTDGNILWGSSVVALRKPRTCFSERFVQQYSVLVSRRILPVESRHTRSWNKDFLNPTWVLQLSDSLLSCQIAPGCFSASCHCPQTAREETLVHDRMVTYLYTLCFMVFLSHQYVVRPQSSGSCKCCLLQLHHLGEAGDGPVFGPQLVCVEAERRREKTGYEVFQDYNICD